MANVLVTGNLGYIGPVVSRVLQAAGHAVAGYDTAWFSREGGVRWQVIADIREPLVHSGWPDVVVHLAGLSNDPMGDLDAGLTVDINLHGTLDFVDQYAGARHVIVSSCAVYGAATALCDEDTPVNPQTTYAACKAEVDYAIHRWRRGLDAVILRLGTVYGYAPNHRLDLVVNKMAYDAIYARGVRVYGDAARPLVHVEDVASAVLWAVEGNGQGVYNVVGENIRMKELARLVAGFAVVPIEYHEAGADTRDYMASGQKIAAAGWHPTRTVAGSLPVLFEHTINLPPGEYVRLNALRRLIESGELDPQTLRYAA